MKREGIFEFVETWRCMGDDLAADRRGPMLYRFVEVGAAQLEIPAIGAGVGLADKFDDFGPGIDRIDATTNVIAGLIDLDLEVVDPRAIRESFVQTTDLEEEPFGN